MKSSSWYVESKLCLLISRADDPSKHLIKQLKQEFQLLCLPDKPEAEFNEFEPGCWTAITGSNYALAQISKYWCQVERTMFELRLDAAQIF